MRVRPIVTTIVIFCTLLLWVVFVQTASKTNHAFDCLHRARSEYQGNMFFEILGPDQLLALARQACEYYQSNPEAGGDWDNPTFWTGTACDVFIEKYGDSALVERLVSIVRDKNEYGMFRAQALLELEHGTADPRHNLWKQLSTRELQELKAACYGALADKSEPSVFRSQAADCISLGCFHFAGGFDEVDKFAEILSAIVADKGEPERLRCEMLWALSRRMKADLHPTDAVRNKLRIELLTVIQDPATPAGVFFNAFRLVTDLYDIRDIASPSMIALVESRLALSPKEFKETATEIVRKLKQAVPEARKEEEEKH